MNLKDLDKHTVNVIDTYLQSWLEYHEDILELEGATRLGIPKCTTLVINNYPQFTIN